MEKLFVDTNIIIDLLAKREPFYLEAAELFTMAINKQLEVSISVITLVNINYILRKQLDANTAITLLRKVRSIVKVFALTDEMIEKALNETLFSDFEDAIQYITALENNQQILITRNLKDFKHAHIPVMTAKQYLKSH